MDTHFCFSICQNRKKKKYRYNRIYNLCDKKKEIEKIININEMSKIIRYLCILRDYAQALTFTLSKLFNENCVLHH